MNGFDHERLDVYKASIEFVTLANTIIQGFPRGRSQLADQLQRASTSMPLNIAEGAGEFSKNDKARFYRIARRSASECAAILDVCGQLKLAEPEKLENGHRLLRRIFSMLVKIAKKYR